MMHAHIVATEFLFALYPDGCQKKSSNHFILHLYLVVMYRGLASHSVGMMTQIHYHIPATKFL